jgi:uncharacterized protein with von Willebrand factor type A (vWA) domain
MALDRGFDPLALERPYLVLEELARPLWLQSIINSRGQVAQRLADIHEFRCNLIDGRGWPLGNPWPYEPVRSMFLERLDQLDARGLCRGQGQICDELVQALLWHIDQIVDYREHFPEVEATAMAVEAFAADWQSVKMDIEAVRAIFDELGDVLKQENWALIRGMLRSQGWADLARVRRVMAQLPELERLVRRLGREAEVQEQTLSRQQQSALEARPIRAWKFIDRRVEGVVAETRGVRRGVKLSRLLPSELVQLRLPKLRMSWYARLAEGSLLGYLDEDCYQERVFEERPVVAQKELEQVEPKRELGPIVLCVDTSASMSGGAEEVAKAVVLEAMRTAAGQKRACYVFAFGGPGEVLEFELGLTAEGLASLLEFMSLGFSGGTDIGEPLALALARIECQGWRLADLLIASDGEFGVTPQLAVRLGDVKRTLGLRVQGVLVGDRETIGLHELCDDIFWVRDWRSVGDRLGVSPVHDKSLTALYFPGALRR